MKVALFLLTILKVRDCLFSSTLWLFLLIDPSIRSRISLTRSMLYYTLSIPQHDWSSMSTLFRPDLRIMVVDDFPAMRRIMKTLLRQCGFRNFIEAENGERAWEFLQRDQDIELIICDWNMPKMTGLEFFKLIRKDTNYKDIPFLMVTAESEEQVISEAVQSGVANYVLKPFNGVTLKEKLKEIDDVLNSAA